MSIELGGRTHRVVARELHVPEREKAWQLITDANDRFSKYQDRTDRQLPIIRLTAAGG